MKYIPFPDRYDKMKYNRCGNSGLLMPAISLGLWHNFGDDMLHKTKVDLCTTAFNLGITHFDLANNYGPPAGGAEKSFGRILRDEFRGLRDQLLISTKAGGWSWEGPYGEWGTRKSVIASCDQSLSRLGIPYVDIFYIDRFDPNTPLEETMLALDQIVRSGRALYIGLSNYPLDVALEAYHILKSLNTPLIVHQDSHSLLSAADKHDEMVEEIASYGLGAIAFSPLAQGLLSNTYLKGIPKDSRASQKKTLSPRVITAENQKQLNALNSVAGQRGQSLAQMAISWVLRNKYITSALIGASQVSQIRDSVKALENLDFSTEELISIRYHAERMRL